MLQNAIFPNLNSNFQILNTIFQFKIIGAIKLYGIVKMTLDLGLCRAFEWQFYVDDDSQPIIGDYFLSFYKLLDDVRLWRLSDAITSLTVPDPSSTGEAEHVKVICGGSPYHALLAEFRNITRPTGTSQEVEHQTVHHVMCKP